MDVVEAIDDPYPVIQLKATDLQSEAERQAGILVAELVAGTRSETTRNHGFEPYVLPKI